MAIDGKKKKEDEKLHLRAQSRPKRYISASEGEEEEENEKDETYVTESENDSSENDEPHPGRSNGSDTEENISEDEISSKRNPAESLRRKRVKEVKRTDGEFKKRKISQKNDEKKHEPVQTEEKKEKETKGGKKKELPIFNDKNVDVDLFHSSPNNVVARKIKVSSNMMVTCRMIDQAESKGNISYDYAAMTLQRETANKRMFEFVMPLGLAPRIITAMQIIIEENKKFFKPQDFVKAEKERERHQD